MGSMAETDNEKAVSAVSSDSMGNLLRTVFMAVPQVVSITVSIDVTTETNIGSTTLLQSARKINDG